MDDGTRFAGRPARQLVNKRNRFQPDPGARILGDPTHSAIGRMPDKTAFSHDPSLDLAFVPDFPPTSDPTSKPISQPISDPTPVRTSILIFVRNFGRRDERQPLKD